MVTIDDHHLYQTFARTWTEQSCQLTPKVKEGVGYIGNERVSRGTIWSNYV
jgi:hypothetical protein